jgi:hypothetical protein
MAARKTIRTIPPGWPLVARSALPRLRAASHATMPPYEWATTTTSFPLSARVSMMPPTNRASSARLAGASGAWRLADGRPWTYASWPVAANTSCRG